MNPENPYTAPATQITDPVPEIPDDIRKKIRNAWIAAIVSGSLTLLVTLVAMSGSPIFGFSAWMLIDVALIFGLAFGIYKKSRTCATVLLVYFIISQILLRIETGQTSGLFMSIIFIYFYWQGVSGTFAYHKLKNYTQA
jgi:serine/threonine-protein kinase